MSSVYTVRYAPQALDDLRDLYSYVTFSLKEPATAQKLVNRIRKAARSLDALLLSIFINSLALSVTAYAVPPLPK